MSIGRQTLTIRRRDQLVVGVLTFLLWSSWLISFTWKGGFRGQLVDIDRTRPTPVRFAIDLNQAGRAEFALLPGIGEAKARRIVELRTRLGRFRQHEELLQVKGIGPKTMAAMRPYLMPLEPE